MRQVEVEIEDKCFCVRVAESEEDRETGLQHIDALAPDEGMLFVFDEVEEVSFWMKDTNINLDIIFIDEDETVIRVATGYAGSEEAHTCKHVKYVLEVNQGSGVKAGDEVFISDENSEENEDDSCMQVLDENGESQMDLDGGERIFSRKHTKILVKFAKKAERTKLDKDYKALGKRVFDFINFQNTKEEDYVEIKKA